MSSPLFLAYGLISKQLSAKSDLVLHRLNTDEKEELAKRNYRAGHRTSQYIYGRVLLKAILSRGLGVNPHSLSIRTGYAGQPLLFHSGRLVEDASLSVSHDKNQLLVAAGFGCQCGVDLQSFKEVDWPLVMHAMGWSKRIARLLEVGSATHPALQLSHVTCSAMVWSAYEAWMKATTCSLAPSDFSWQRIRLVEEDANTQSSYYEMTVDARYTYNVCRVIMSVRANEVLTIATIAL